MEEEFRDIIGYEGRYQVSNLGRVKSLKRDTKYQNTFKSVRERILKPHIDFGGYYLVALSNVRIRTFKVHRLVAIHFIPNSENKPEVNHKNGIKTDNCVENLEWNTPKENSIHSYKIGLKKAPKGEDSSVSKLKDSDVLEIRNLYIKSGIYHIKFLAKKFNVSYTTIQYIVTRKTWTHI